MLSTRRILIADDDLEVRNGMVDLLSPLGMRIFQAESGTEALEIVRQRPLAEAIELLVLDMHMPGCTGLDVLCRLRDSLDGDNPRCIFYSGNSTVEVRQRALDAGAFAFLDKPVPPHVLRGEVLRALGEEMPG